MSTYFEAPDGGGEPTIWEDVADRPDYPQPVLRLCDISPTYRGLWPLIVEAVIAGGS